MQHYTDYKKQGNHQAYSVISTCCVFASLVAQNVEVTKLGTLFSSYMKSCIWVDINLEYLDGSLYPLFFLVFVQMFLKGSFLL